MKRFGTVILCLMMSVTFIAQNKAQNPGVLFEEGAFAQALAKAKNNKKGPKIIFMDCYTTWCGPCKYMSEKIFPQELVGKFYNTNFVNIKMDMEKGEGIELAKKYKKPIVVYVFSYDHSYNEEDFEDLENLKVVKPIPEVILKVYRAIFKE